MPSHGRRAAPGQEPSAEPSAGEREGAPLANKKPSAGEREGAPLARRQQREGALLARKQQREGAPLARNSQSRRRRPWGTVRYRGIALFVCLVVLLALGVAGVSASQTVSLEMRMTRNGHDGELAMQAAESALREGERLVASTGFDPAAPGFYAGAIFGVPEPWSRPETWRGTNSRVATPLSGVAEPPRFIVERVASWVDPDGGMEVFRVTARAIGGTRHARVVLQSAFALSSTRWRHGVRAETRSIRLSWRELEAP